MARILGKNKYPFPKDEILTQSYLVDKISNDMRLKYKKVFSVINYDEYSLKNDIQNLLSKYISNSQKEINIKYIESTILNKIREKYKTFKAPLNPIKNKNNKLIKIEYSSPNKYNSYLNLDKKSEKNKNLSSVRNKSNTFKNKVIEEKIIPK